MSAPHQETTTPGTSSPAAPPDPGPRRDRRAPPRLKDWFLGWSWWLKEQVLPDYVSGASPILVGGCGRSGTTLLQVILDAHPDLCCVRESSIFHLGKLDTSKLANRIGLPIEDVRAIADSSRRHGEFVERVCGAFAERLDKPRWADKSPRNVRRLPYIFRHFPKARFVHLLRDGRDAACSLRTHPKWTRVGDELVEAGTWKPFEDCARRWNDDVREGLAWRGHEGYHELRYEDLVSDPERRLRELFAFLGVRWTPEVLEFHRVRNRSDKDPGFEKPLFRSSVARWRRNMSPEDGRVFLDIAGPLLRELGYAEDDDWVHELNDDNGRPPR